MTRKKLQKFFFLALLIVSLSSSVYLNGEAQELRTRGFDVSYFSSEDTEGILSDARLLSFIIDKVGDVVFIR